MWSEAGTEDRLRGVKVEAERLQMRPREILRLRKMEPPRPSLECAVDSEWNDVINFIVLCSFVELFIHRNHKTQLWRSKANNIIKHIFMGKVQHFHGQTQILMAKNRTFSSSGHVFVVKICYTLADIFSWAKCNIFMSKVQRFHGQTELRVITACVLPH